MASEAGADAAGAVHPQAVGEEAEALGFLRHHRHELFDDEFQAELETMYRDTGAGSDPVPPAQMAMALLLQGYLGLSDADAVEATVLDLRWQLVLGCLGATETPFSQGTLQGFRERLIAHDMDRRLLERTVELAKRTREFDWKKLPKTLRVAIDSAPLEGAGRVEDPSTCSRTRRARWWSARPTFYTGPRSGYAARRAPCCSSARASRRRSTATGATRYRRRRR